MAQLTLRTLLAYIDDTLEPGLARELGAKVAESELAQELIERIKRVTRRRGLKSPTPSPDDDGVSDPNTVAEYLSNSLDTEQVTRLEETCLQSDAHLAEVAACHQILTLILTEPVRVPQQARQRMYKLVPPPASDPTRRGKAPPVGTVAPESRESETDDPDAALLLGFGRYSSTASAVRRLAAVAAVLGLAACLAIAVIMALPGHQPEPPAADTRQYAVAPPITPVPSPPTAVPPVIKKDEPEPPAPPEVTPKPKEPVDPKVAPPPKKVDDLAPRVAAPRDDRVVIGKVETLNVLAVTRAENGKTWLRADPGDEPAVFSSDLVMALPGYKVDVQLESGIKVQLWGNTPEQLPTRLLESKVRFHVPERSAEGKDEFAADISLLAGRIYLTTTKTGGGKVRVRVAGQTFDIALPDSKSDVVIEVVKSYDPGMPFARQGGILPRVEVQSAVVRGSASFTIPDRFKSFAKVAAPSVLAWDSKTNVVAEPKALEAMNTYFERFLLVSSDQGKLVQKALSEMAGRVKDREGVKLMLAEILTEQPDQNRIVIGQLAVYAQAAIVVDPDELKPLLDLLTDEVKGYARLATVNALALWVAQAPTNTATLGTVLATKIRNEQDVETILRLLRGTVTPTKSDPSDQDRLIDLLSNASVAVRELALWNLINFVDPAAARTPGLTIDVAQMGTPPYDKFLKAWKARIDDLKAAPKK